MAMQKPKLKNRELQAPPTSEMNFNPDLAEGLNFDREDLTLNRQGHMTDAQIERKLQVFSSLRATESALLAIAFLTGLLVAGMMMNNGGIWVVIGGISGILIMMFVAWGISLGNTVKRELETGILDHRIGEISITSVDSGSGTVIAMGDEVYRANLGIMRQRYSKPAQAFKNSESYILYFLPESYVIISAEPFDDVESTEGLNVQS